MHVPSSTILDDLRRGTRAYHDRLEAGLNLLDLGLDRDGYRGVLERFWGFCLPAERAVEASGVWGALGLSDAEGKRGVWLEGDLLALGHTPATLAQLPVHAGLPQLADPPGAAGYLYVMEGATLGGSVISRHLQRSLGITRTNGGAFFGSYGAEVGPRWQRFTRALTAFAARSGAGARIVQSAGHTFCSLERWLLPPA